MSGATQTDIVWSVSLFLHQERELKLAADSVLCEVRKKQADVKRMQDILRSLEKLRKLRKEAASRKGKKASEPAVVVTTA